MNQSHFSKIIPSFLFTIVFFFCFINSAYSAQFVGQIISQYQSMDGSYYPYVLDTGDQILPLELRDDSNKQTYRRILRRSSGKILKITGTPYRMNQSEPGDKIQKTFKVTYINELPSPKTFRGIISIRKGHSNHLDKYEIKQIDVQFPRSLSIVLGSFEDQIFDLEYQDQEVEIEYSESYVSWRNVKFVKSIKVL